MGVKLSEIQIFLAQQLVENILWIKVITRKREGLVDYVPLGNPPCIDTRTVTANT